MYLLKMGICHFPVGGLLEVQSWVLLPDVRWCKWMISRHLLHMADLKSSALGTQGTFLLVFRRWELAGENRVPFSKEDFREARTNVLLKYTDCDASRLQVKRHRPVKVKSDAVA